MLPPYCERQEPDPVSIFLARLRPVAQRPLRDGHLGAGVRSFVSWSGKSKTFPPRLGCRRLALQRRRGRRRRLVYPVGARRGQGLDEGGGAAIAACRSALGSAVGSLAADKPRLALEQVAIAMAAVDLLAAEAFAAARAALVPTRAAEPRAVLPAHSLCAFPGAALLTWAVTCTRARSGCLATAPLEAGVEQATGGLVTGLAGLAIRATAEATVVRADSGGVTHQAIAARRDVRQRPWRKISRGSLFAATDTMSTDVAIGAGVAVRPSASAGIFPVTRPADAIEATAIAGSRVTPAYSLGRADRRLRRAVLAG
jgi:hypothetical protein